MPRKRKEDARVKELVPKDSPWTESDWFNEQSLKCRAIVVGIRACLSGAVELFEGSKKLPIQDSPRSVLDHIPRSSSKSGDDDGGDNNSNSNVYHFDRGRVQFLKEQGHWGVFHPSWGELLNASATAAPWRIMPAQDESTRKKLQFAIYKPSGLWQDELNGCVATLKYIGEGESTFPLLAAAHHLKVADFMFCMQKAMNLVKARKSQKLRSLRVELSNGQTVDLGPILQVIVDDEDGDLFVEDATDVLTALIGYASTVTKVPGGGGGGGDEDGEGEDEEEGPKDWVMEHETCGDTELLFEGWEESNKLTAQSFVSLCLGENTPDSAPSERTAARTTNDNKTSPRKRARKIPDKWRTIV